MFALRLAACSTPRPISVRSTLNRPAICRAAANPVRASPADDAMSRASLSSTKLVSGSSCAPAPASSSLRAPAARSAPVARYSALNCSLTARSARSCTLGSGTDKSVWDFTTGVVAGRDS